MEKKSLLSANWLKAAFLLVVLCLSGVAAKANTTQTVDLDYLVPGQTYTIDANTTVTGRYFANYDGTITLTSSVDANTNFVPFTDNTYTEAIETVLDEAAKTKTFVFSAGNRGKTVYFKSEVSTTPYEVTFDYVRASNLEDYVASIVPEDGSEVSSLKDFTINFTTKIFGARYSAKLYKGETLVAEKALENKMNVNTYSFSFDEEITEAGDYTLVFPEESFVCGSGMKGSSEWKFYYTVKPAAPAITATWSIAEGATLDDFESVSLTFEGVESAASKSMYPCVFYKVADDGSVALVQNYCSEGVMDASASGKTITYSIDKECYVNLQKGNYRIVIPAGMVKFNGDNANLNTEEYVLNFYLNLPDAPAEIDAAFTADPANNSTVTAIKEITLTFTGYSSIEVAEMDMMQGTNIPTAYMTDDLTGALMPAGYVFFEAGAASNSLRLYVDPNFNGGADSYSMEGSYVIRIPAGVVKFADGVSKEILLNYTVKAATPTIDLGDLVPGQTYTIDANTIVTGRYFAKYDGTITLTSSVDANTNFVPFTDNTYTEAIETVLDEAAKTKTFVFSAGNRGKTVYFKSEVSTTPYEVTFDYVRASNLEDYVASIVPEDGSEVSSLKDFTINFTTKIFGARYSAKLYKGETLVAEKALENKMNVNTYSFSFDEEITEAGDYTLVFPEETFTCGSGMKGSSEWKFSYTIEAAAPAITATWSIEEGAVIDSFESVSLTFTGVEKAASKSMYPYAFYKVEDDGTAVLVPNYCSDGVMDASASGTTITYSIDRECYVNLYGGNYRIVIPAGSVKFNGDNENLNTEEYVLNFYLNLPDAPAEIDAAFTADPANNSTVSEIREIILSFPDYSSIELAELDMMMGTNIPQAFMEDELTGSYMPAGYVFFEAAAASNALRLYVPVEFMGVDAYTTEGNYKIVIPAGVVKFADGISKEISLYYTVKAAQQPKMIVSLVGGATAEEAVTLSNLNATATFENTTATITSEWIDFGIYGVVPGSTIETCYVHYSANKVSDTEYALIPNADQLATLDANTAYKFKLPEGYFTYADGSKSAAYETWIKYEAPSFEPVVITINPAGGTEDAPVGLAPEEFEFTVTLTGAESVEISAAALNEDTCIYLQSWAAYWEEWSNAVAYKPVLVDGTTYKLVPYDEYWGDALNYLSAGEYRIHIPSGTFVFNGDTSNVNAAFDAYYTAVFPDMTVDPAPDTVVDQLDYIAICFNNENLVTASETVTATLKKDGVAVEEVLGSVRWGVVRNTVSYWFASSHLDAGEYEFVIPADAITLGSGKVFEGATFKYTIEGETPENPYGVVFEPQGGATPEEAVDFYSLQVKVSPKDGETITWVNRAYNTCFQTYDEVDQTWENSAYWAEFTDNGDGSCILYNEFPDGFQVYRLYIPAGEFYYNGDESAINEEMILYYNLTEDPNAPKIVISPEMGSVLSVIDNDTFTVEFVNVESAKAVADATIAITNNEYIYTYLKAEAIEGEPAKFRLVDTGSNYGNSFPLPIKAAGEYGIYIASGAFEVNGSYNGQIWEEPYVTVDGSLDVSPKINIYPAEGSTVEKIDAETFILEITGVSEVVANSVFETDPAARYIGVTSGTSFVHLLKPEAIEGETNKFRLVPCEDQSAVGAFMDFPIETEGAYGLFIKAGSFIADGAELPNGANIWNKTLLNVAKSTRMIVTPENGATIDSYEDIQIKFEGVTTVEINPNTLKADYGKMMLVADDNWEKSVVVKPVLTGAYTYGLEIMDGQLPETYTSLLFFMEEGSFFMDGNDAPGVEYTYNVAAAGEPKMVVSPKAGTIVTAITSDVITISFENVTEVTINDYALQEASCKISIIDPKGNYIRTMPQAIEGETNMFRLVNFDGSDINLTAQGTYGIWINGFPQPAFYMDGKQCPEFYEKNFITVAPYTYVTEPAEGLVASLETIALTFDPAVESINTAAAGNVVLYKDGQEVESVALADLVLVGWGAMGSKSVAMEFSKAYTDGGNYKVVIPEGAIQMAGGVTNSEIALNYAIVGVGGEWTAVADPAPGVVAELTDILVTFEGANQLSVSPEAGPNDFPYYGTVAEDGTVTKVPYSIFAWLEGGNKISLGIQNAEEKLSEPGKYAIIIPAGYCLVDGVAMTEDIRFDYTIEGAQPEYTVIISPADGSTVKGEQLYEITVTFDGAKAIELNGDQATTLYQLDENGNPIANIYQTMSVEGNVAKFSVMELHKPYLDPAGTFQFTIPVGMVTITDNNDVVGKNKENIVATYISEGSSVDTIGVDAKDLNIYTVSGMLIKRNGTYEDVKALEPGIYIINGKKFYVK